MMKLFLYINYIWWEVMFIRWGLINIHTLNYHPSSKTGGPLRLNKTIFIHNKHQFRDVNEKIGVNSIFKIRWYGMPAVRLNMEITHDSVEIKTAAWWEIRRSRRSQGRTKKRKEPEEGASAVRGAQRTKGGKIKHRPKERMRRKRKRKRIIFGSSTLNDDWPRWCHILTRHVMFLPVFMVQSFDEQYDNITSRKLSKLQKNQREPREPSFVVF